MGDVECRVHGDSMLSSCKSKTAQKSKAYFYFIFFRFSFFSFFKDFMYLLLQRRGGTEREKY